MNTTLPPMLARPSAALQVVAKVGVAALLTWVSAGAAPAPASAPGPAPSMFERGVAAAKELASPSTSSNTRVRVLEDGGFEVLKIQRGEQIPSKKVETIASYGSADPYYALNTVIDAGNGNYVRGDGATATAEEYDDYSKRRNCAVPSATVVAASWDETKQGGWFGYDKKTNEPTEYRHYGNLAGVHCSGTTRATALGYQTALKGDVGSFVAENALGEKIRVNGTRLNASTRLVGAEVDVNGAAALGPAEVTVHGNTFLGATSEAEMMAGVTPDGGVVQLGGKAFAGFKESFDIGATMRGPFGIKLGGRGSLEMSTGAGLEGSALLSASWDGRFRVNGKFAAAVGLGSGASGSVEVDMSNVVTGVDMDDVTMRENTAKIVSDTISRIEKGELILKPGLSMSTFAQDLQRMTERLTPDDPNNKQAIRDLLAKSFQDANLVVKLTGPGAPVPVGTSMDFKALASGGTPPYTIRWTTSLGKSIEEDTTKDVWVSMSQRGLSEAGNYWMAVEVTDRSTPRPLKAKAKFPVTIVGKFAVELTHRAVQQAGTWQVTLDAKIAGGVPPYTVNWSWGGTKLAPTKVKGASATLNKTVDPKALASGKALEAGVLVLDSSVPQPQLAQARRAVSIELPQFRASASAPSPVPPEAKVALAVSWLGGEPPYTISVRASTSGTQTFTRSDSAGLSLNYHMPKKPGTETFAVTVSDQAGRKSTAGCVVVVAVEDKSVAAVEACPRCGYENGHGQGSPFQTCEQWRDSKGFFGGTTSTDKGVAGKWVLIERKIYQEGIAKCSTGGGTVDRTNYITQGSWSAPPATLTPGQTIELQCANKFTSNNDKHGRYVGGTTSWTQDIAGMEPGSATRGYKQICSARTNYDKNKLSDSAAGKYTVLDGSTGQKMQLRAEVTDGASPFAGVAFIYQMK